MLAYPAHQCAHAKECVGCKRQCGGPHSSEAAKDYVRGLFIASRGLAGVQSDNVTSGIGIPTTAANVCCAVSQRALLAFVTELDAFSTLRCCVRMRAASLRLSHGAPVR